MTSSNSLSPEITHKGVKILTPQIHGFLDYSLVFVFYLAPTLLNFSRTASVLAYIVGTVQLITSLLTAYPLGVVKLVPFPIHGVLESLVAVAVIASPWLFGFAEETAARNFYVAAGVGLLAVVAITDYKGKGTAQDRRLGL